MNQLFDLGETIEFTNLVALWENENEICLLENAHAPKAKYDTMKILHKSEWQM